MPRVRATRLRAIAQPSMRQWTPAALGAALMLWLDGNDASTFTLDGVAVSEWRDKSGAGRHFYNSGSNRPTYSPTALNGKGGPVFDGVDDWLDTASNWTTTNGMSWYFVAQRTSDSPPAQTLIGNRLNTSDAFPISIPTNPSLNVARFGGANDYAALSTWRNGSVVQPNSGVSSLSRDGWFTALGSAGIFAALGANQFVDAPRLARLENFIFLLAGSICEVVATSTTSSTQERQRIEGYLAHKWGLASSLPANHPYRNTPPTA